MLHLNNMREKIHQSGTALISALFIVAITAILATAIAWRQRLLINQTQWMINADQVYLSLKGVQDWAKSNLTQYATAWQKIAVTHTPPLYSPIFPSLHFHGIKITGRIQDQQALFNINTLTNPNNQWRFIKLLQAVDPHITRQKAQNIVQAITNWMTPSSDDNHYLNLKPPYRAPHQPMANISELRAIQGITANIYLAIAPYITAIPPAKEGVQQRVAININHASAPVLLTLSPSLNLTQAKTIQACVQAHSTFINTANFLSQCVTRFGIGALSGIGIKSHYFLVKAQANKGSQQMILSTFLQLYADKKNIEHANIVWHALN